MIVMIVVENSEFQTILKWIDNIQNELELLQVYIENLAESRS